MNRRRFAELAILGMPAGTRIARAAAPLALPTPEQVAWQNLELQTFIHFGPLTWRENSADKHFVTPAEMKPEKLDVEQWVAVAESMGARQIVFVAKHFHGFCWWQTQTTTYGVKELSWRGGKGDVMRDLSACCRRRGMRLGVYISPADDFQKVAVSGRCIDPARQAEYNEAYRQQLTELLTRYGEIGEVWFDGSNVIEMGDILKRYAPHAMVFQSKYATIRWVGNEEGFVPYPNWNAVSEAAAKSGVATGKDGDADGQVWLPTEVDVRMRRDWFWSPDNESSLKSVEELMAIYYRSVGNGASLLMNQTPDRTGLIPEPDVKRTAEFGAEIRRRFGQSVKETRGQGNTVELRFDRPAKIDHVVTMEDIAFGQRVREYRIEGLISKEWREIARGSSIGQKRIDPVKPVEVSAIRWQCAKSVDTPKIIRLAVYHAGAQSSSAGGPVPAYRVLRSWTAQDLPTSEAVWDLDLAPHCDEAGQYEVTLFVTGGTIAVRSAAFSMGGVEMPQFVRRIPGNNRMFFINLPGIDTSLRLRLVVRRNQEPSFGQVVLRRVP